MLEGDGCRGWFCASLPRALGPALVVEGPVPWMFLCGAFLLGTFPCVISEVIHRIEIDMVCDIFLLYS